jgi:hypothetical protein
MKPNFDQLKKEVDYQEDIFHQIVQHLIASFFKTYEDYKLYKKTMEKEKFLFSLHNLLNNIGLLGIPEELNICREYYIQIQSKDEFYINQEVDEIFQNVNDFFKQNKNIY